MLLEELDNINEQIASSLNPVFDHQFSYGSGTIEDMDMFILEEQPTLPLIWWIRQNEQAIKTAEFIPMSDIQQSTIDATYVIWIANDIDNSLKERNADAWLLDSMILQFTTAMNRVKPSIGTISISALSQSRNLRNTPDGLQGKGFSMSILSPDNIDFCVDCGN